MAEIDRIAFAETVTLALAAGGLSYRALAASNPGLTTATLSRAAGGSRLTAGNFLAVCRALELDPWRYFLPRPEPPRRRRVTLKTILKQHVTSHAPRETRGAAERSMA